MLNGIKKYSKSPKYHPKFWISMSRTPGRDQFRVFFAESIHSFTPIPAKAQGGQYQSLHQDNRPIEIYGFNSSLPNMNWRTISYIIATILPNFQTGIICNRILPRKIFRFCRKSHHYPFKLYHVHDLCNSQQDLTQPRPTRWNLTRHNPWYIQQPPAHF